MINKRRAFRNIKWARLFPVVAIVLLLSVGGCAPQADVAAVEVIDMAAEEAGVRQALADHVVAANQPGQAGADGYASVFAEDGILLPPNAERQDGRAAISAFILPLTSAEGWYASWEANRIEISASGDLAYAVGTYESSLQDADGNTIEDRGSFLNTFRKQADGSWQTSSGLWNSDLPLTAPVD